MKNKLLFIVVPILAILVLGWGYVSIGHITYSEGDRVGVIAKVSSKGLFIKTWEGELHMGSLQEGGIPKVWEFSIDDPKMVEIIQAAQLSGKRVSLHYKEQLLHQNWRGATSYFVIGVKYIE